MTKYYSPVDMERNKASVEYAKEVIEGADADCIMEMIIAAAFRAGFDHRVNVEARAILDHIKKWMKE